MSADLNKLELELKNISFFLEAVKQEIQIQIIEVNKLKSQCKQRGV